MGPISTISAAAADRLGVRGVVRVGKAGGSWGGQAVTHHLLLGGLNYTPRNHNLEVKALAGAQRRKRGLGTRKTASPGQQMDAPDQFLQNGLGFESCSLQGPSGSSDAASLCPFLIPSQAISPLFMLPRTLG